MLVLLSNDERFLMAEKEARMLLKYPELPQYFRLRSLILLSHSVENWYDGKDTWYSLRRMWLAKTAGSNENIMMDRLRRFLHELDEDILEDRPEDRYNPEGLTEYESVPDEDEDGISDELENGDSSDERVDMSDQEEQGADISDQEKGTEDEEQILEDTKSQQSDDSEFDDSVTNLLFDLENESSKLFTSSTIDEGDSISPHFEPQTFLEAHKKVAGDDDSVASAETNKQNEPDSTLHLQTIVTNKSSPATLKIDGNTIEEENAQPDNSTKEEEAELRNTLDEDKIHDIQPTCLNGQEEAAIFGDTPLKKRKTADQSSTQVNEIHGMLPSQDNSYIEPSKQDTATNLDVPAPNKRMKND
ncbi:hypothetical protein D6D21_07066 [Aureobasidium pullulans]|uniref:Uncharacterized protein n=1 Tax=Aureobasidium pullulans TaxID=5580 RepID=A0AB74ISE9_AURPU|nr:hypothetical protein D6D21_07066 [Aureobasidium pullulans]